VKTDTQQSRIEHEAEQVKARAEAEAKKLAEEEKKAKAEAKKGISRLEANGDNPVVVGNAIAVVALSAGLGFGAYKKYAAGEMSWKIAGAWSGVVGLFVIADYYLST
jgi:regulator of protease activity HflC (stomatin/prohibitin superfamily)